MAGSILLQQALELHEAGLCVIPLIERSKRPALGSWKQYQRQRPGLEELHGWFARGSHNLAVVCGQVSGPPGLGLAVLDFDRPGFETWAEEHSEIAKSTWISATGREDGRHVWLLVPAGAGSAQFGCGEVKAEGGYIVAPPSTHPTGRRYRWLRQDDSIAVVGDLSLLGLGIGGRSVHRRSGLVPGSLQRLPDEVRDLPEIAPPSSRAAERILRRALQRATGGNRNCLGFWLAARLRNSGYDPAMAANFMLCYQAAVAGLGDHAYTVTEALRSLRSAYSRPAIYR